MVSNAPDPEVLYETSDGVATITLNRPHRNNAWTPRMETELREAFATAADDDDACVILLTGAGKSFCVGVDSEFLASRAAGAAPSPHGATPARLAYIRAMPKPVIAALNGPAAGLGLCVALYCDIRYMADGARLSTAFARRGLVAEHGIAWILNRLIGPMATSDLLLSGRTVNAQEAARLGLVILKPSDELRNAARAAAVEIASLSSPRSTRIIKHQILASQEQTLSEAIALADTELAKCAATEDFREGIAHFLEKRAPRFTGR